MVTNRTVISHFMPRYQTLKFSYNFKAKRYNVNLMNKINRNPSMWDVYLWLNEEIEHDEKVTLTPELVTKPKMTTVLYTSRASQKRLRRYMHASKFCPCNSDLEMGQGHPSIENMLQCYARANFQHNKKYDFDKQICYSYVMPTKGKQCRNNKTKDIFLVI